MRGKEKAIDLYNKFYDTSSHPHHVESRKQFAKQCALIAVDEMISFSKRTFSFIHPELEGPSVRYLEEVKQEIEKL